MGRTEAATPTGIGVLIYGMVIHTRSLKHWGWDGQKVLEKEVLGDTEDE